MSLFCLIFGEKDEKAFLVRVNRGNTVDKLKRLIKAENSVDFRDVDASCLMLWKWNQPGDAGRVNAVGLDSSNVLNPMTKMTSVFEDDSPQQDCIHIIIKIPECGR